VTDDDSENTKQGPVTNSALQDALTPAIRPQGSTPAGELPRVGRQQFAAACEVHIDRVWRQLRAMGVAEQYVDDATQEVFLIAYRKLDGFEGQSCLGTWLYSIAYRVGCNYRRKTRRDPSAELVEGHHVGGGPSPEQALENKRAAQFVQGFCDRLSEKLRDVFVLCLLEGQPAPAVAELLSVSENTVYSRIRLVRAAFRKELVRLEVELP
jgi:RNA polymerase sigma-70 factor (ECF subfamily)